MVVIEADAVRYGMRIRTETYYDRYPNQFTVRASRKSGARTEMDKIIFDKTPDRLFYGFGTNDGRLISYKIADFSVFRGLFGIPWMLYRDEIFSLPRKSIYYPDMKCHINYTNNEQFLCFDFYLDEFSKCKFILDDNSRHINI